MLMTDDFFLNRLDQLIDLRHPLAVLANRMPWQEIEASLAHRFARQVRSGKKIEDMDMFGATQITAGAGVSNAGRPRLPTRLMVSLLYLKHAFNESDHDLTLVRRPAIVLEEVVQAVKQSAYFYGLTCHLVPPGVAVYSIHIVACDPKVKSRRQIFFNYSLIALNPPSRSISRFSSSY